MESRKVCISVYIQTSNTIQRTKIQSKNVTMSTVVVVAVVVVVVAVVVVVVVFK